MVTLIERICRRSASRHGHVVASHRNSKIVRAIATACEWFLFAYKNRSYDMTRNGEFRVVRSLGLAGETVALDVGANTGDYTAFLRASYPATTIHTFEINPAHIQALRRRFEGDPKIHFHAKGLSDRSGQTVVHEMPAESQMTSIYRLEGITSTRSFVAQIETGDSFFQQAKIEQIHFMKVDTEGHDLCVLKGFLPQLSRGKIHVLQFEYNETSIPAHVLLRDFFDLLEPFGYEIGKVYPSCVEFGPYHCSLEDHRGSNYVAVGPGGFAREARARLLGNAI